MKILAVMKLLMTLANSTGKCTIMKRPVLPKHVMPVHLENLTDIIPYSLVVATVVQTVGFVTRVDSLSNRNFKTTGCFISGKQSVV